MALINFSIEHGRSPAEAKERLREAIAEVERKAQSLIKQVEWAADETAVRIVGTGFEVRVRVDERMTYVEGEIPWVAKLLGSQAVTHVKQILIEAFEKPPKK